MKTFEKRVGEGKKHFEKYAESNNATPITRRSPKILFIKGVSIFQISARYEWEAATLNVTLTNAHVSCRDPNVLVLWKSKIGKMSSLTSGNRLWIHCYEIEKTRTLCKISICDILSQNSTAQRKSSIIEIYKTYFPYLGKKSLCSFEVNEVTVETNTHTCNYICYLNNVNATEIHVDVRGLSKFSKPPMQVCELVVKENI